MHVYEERRFGPVDSLMSFIDELHQYKTLGYIKVIDNNSHY